MANYQSFTCYIEHFILSQLESLFHVSFKRAFNYHKKLHERII